MIRSALLALLIPAAMAAKPPLVDFPTANRALIAGPSGDFFMYVNRDFGGQKTKPWQGGQFGYVRGPQQRNGTVVFNALHEGIDIRPLRRDGAGDPLDPVLATAAGTVAYVNDRASASNYGRYIVIEHRIEGSPFYSLYAHLSSAAVAPGQTVRQGQTIGTMGHTGSGIDRERSHLHFEFCMMVSPNFESWIARIDPSDANPHGNFNGRNLVGVDPAALLLTARENPETFSLREYLRAQDVTFKLLIPTSTHFNLLRNYPWLMDKGTQGVPPAWILSFTRYGTPVRAEPFAQPVAEPRVLWVRDSKLPISSLTRGLVAGSPGDPTLTPAGRQFVDLLMAPSPSAVQ